MSEFASDFGRRSGNQSLDRLFEELSQQMERTAFLYGNAAFFDIERARQLRRALDAAIAKAEGFVMREDGAFAPNTGANPGRADRAQRIEAEIVSYIQDVAKPVTIDELVEHLGACSLGEPRPSLVTRMSRMVASGKLARSARGYYELTDG